MNLSRVDLLLNRLDKVQKTSKGWKACCPAHDDRSPSLSIGEGSEGQVLLKCWAGCSALDIVQSLGITMADLFEQDQNYRPSARKKLIRPNWHKIIRLVFHDCTVIAICADKVITTGSLTQDDVDCLRTSYRSLSAVIDTAEALAMPKRKAA